MTGRGALARTRGTAGAALALVALAAALAPTQPAAAAGSTAATLHVAPAGGGVLGAGALRVGIGVENDGAATLPAGTVQLALEQATVADAQTLADRLADPTPYGQLQGYGVGSAAVPALAPGARTLVTITVPAAVISAYTRASGAHLLAAQLRTAGEDVAAGASVVVRSPTGAMHVRLATVVPLTLPVADAPTGLASAAVVEAQSAPGGAWASALDAVRADPAATLALDPAVPASIRLLGSAAPASGTALLTALAALPNPAIELPYADGDVTLERAAGADRVLGPTGFASAVDLTTPSASPSPTPTPAATRSASTTADPTAWAWASTKVGWPVAGTTSAADLPFLARSGDTAVLLSSTDVRDTPARRAAGPLATVDGTRVLVADAAASTLLATAASEHGAAADGALADLTGLLAVDATAGGSPTILAVAGRTAPRRLAEVLARVRAQAWVDDADLTDLTGAPRPAAVALAAHAVDAASTAKASPLVDADQALAALGDAVPNGGGTALTAPYRLSVLAMLGAGWRQARSTWSTDVASTTTALRGLVGGAVVLLPLKTVTNLGVDSSLPVAVRNTLPFPVRVVVSGVPSNGRMIVPGPIERTVAAQQSAALLNLPTRSISDGDVQIAVQLATPGGLALGPAQTVDVSVNAGWDTVGAGIFLAALLALFVVGVYRNLTRRRRQARAATA